MNRTPNAPTRNPTEPADPSATRPVPGQDGALDEHDLDAVVGGAMRRGPGTQTEDDVYVG